MPVDGTKNFTAPGDAPSYFTNETAPASARVANQATFTEDEVRLRRSGSRQPTEAASMLRPVGPPSMLWQIQGLRRVGALRESAVVEVDSGEVAHTSETRSASAAKGSGKSGTPAAAGKVNTTKHAKSGIRQQAAVPRTTAAASFALNAFSKQSRATGGTGSRRPALAGAAQRWTGPYARHISGANGQDPVPQMHGLATTSLCSMAAVRRLRWMGRARARWPIGEPASAATR